MRIFFVNRFYAPDISATAQILTDVAEGLAARGHRISVITSRMLYEDPKAGLQPRQEISGVDVIRVRTTRFGRAGLVGRLIDYLSFYLACFFSILKHARQADIVVSKTDPPLLSVVSNLACRLRGARAVNWLQDVFPEVAIHLGVPLAKPPVSSLLIWLRNRSLKAAARVVVIGPKMAEHVRGQGVFERSIVEIPNFCDDTSIVPCAHSENRLRRVWQFSPQEFVVGYSGNLGRAHDLATILGAAEALKAYSDIKFLFIGGGYLRSMLEQEALERGLSSVVLKPYQPREELALSLGVPDLHWVALRPELEGLILPSKIYGIAAAGRPVLMIGDPRGEIGRMVSTHGFGSVVPIGAVELLTARILSWRNAPEDVRLLGSRARRFIDMHAARTFAIDRWEALIKDLT